MQKRASRARYSDTAWGLLAVAAAAALWAVAAVTARVLFDDGVDPLELVQARAIISAIGLAFVPSAWRKASTALKDLRWVVALGACIALVNAVYYVAIQRLAVAVAIVLQYLGPGLVVLWVAFRSRSRPSREVALAVVGAFCGVVLVSELPKGDFGSLDLIGIGAGLASAASFAAYTLLSEKTGEIYGVVGGLFRGFVAASLLWVIFQSFRGWPAELFTAEHLPLVLFIGVFGTLIAFFLYLWGVQRIRAERASIAATLEPVLVAIIGWLWLGQALSLLQLAGGALIIGAVVSLQVARGEPPAAPDL